MIIKIFAVIGVIASFIFVVSLLAILDAFVADAVVKHRHKKQIKNRFKGGPTAKCFCKDCKYYSEKGNSTVYNHLTGKCAAHNMQDVSDNWYCWAATPLEYDEIKRS